MSYCTAARQAAEAKVRKLEERLKEAMESGQPIAKQERLRQEIEQAVAEWVTIGDCGD